MSDKPETQERLPVSEERLPVSEERLTVRKRNVETGRVRVRTVPEQIEQRVSDTVTSEDVHVERVPIGRDIETVPEVRQDGDTWVFPVVEQIAVVEKRLVLKEEVRVRRSRRTEAVEMPVTLRSTRVVIERDRHTGDETPETQRKEMTMASRTLTALFDSRADAERAEEQLIDIGIAEDSIHIVDQSATATPATTGTAPAGLWDKVKNIFLPDQDRYVYQEGVRRGGTLLAAQVEEPRIDAAIAALQECNPVDLEQREADWRRTGWSGRQASPDDGSGVSASVAGAQEEVIPIAEEQLRVGKREIDRGGVRVRSYVVEEPVRESVSLRDERVEVERRPVDRPISAASGDDPLRERTVEMHETAEEPVIQKDTRVKEEVVVRKRADERVEQVEDKVRRTQVDVEKEGGRRPPPAPGTGRAEPPPASRN